MKRISSTSLANVALAVTLFLLPCALCCQYAIVTGTVQDNYDKTNISGVHISYQNALNGVTSNSDGNFQLRIENVALVDSITFSHIAYKAKSYSLQELLTDDLVVELTAAVYETPNVVITQLNGEQLISRALGNIEEYFHNEDHNIGGFYREKSYHIGKSELIYLAEGQVNVFKSEYQNHPEYHFIEDWKAPRDQIQLVQGEIIKQNKSYEAYNMLQPIPEITNGPTVPLTLDYLKSSRAFLSEDEFKNYKYKLKGYEQIGGTNYYLISFEPKHNYIITKGTFYYDADKEIVTSAKYQFTDEGLKSYNKQNLIDLTSRTFEVSYRQRGSKYTIDRVLVENIFSHKILGDQIYNELEFITTSVNTDDVHPISREKELNQGHDLNHFIKLGKRPSWGTISLIPREKAIAAMLVPEREKTVPEKIELANTKVKYHTLEKNFALSAANNKISLLISSASWCQPCVRMKLQAFHDPKTVDLLNKEFYITILDYDNPKDKRVIKDYAMSGLPNLLALSAEGEEIGRVIGYGNIHSLFEGLTFLSEKDKSLKVRQNLLNDLAELRQSYSEKLQKQKKQEKSIFKKIEKDTLTPKEIALLLYTAEVHDFKSVVFKNFLKHKDDFQSYYSPKQYTDKLLEAIITHHYYEGRKHNYKKGKITPKGVSKLVDKHMPDYADIILSRFMAEHHQHVTLDKEASYQSWLKYFDAIPSEDFESYDLDLFNFISKTNESEILLELKAIILKHKLDTFTIKDHLMQIDFLLKGDQATPRNKVIAEDENKTFISRY